MGVDAEVTLSQGERAPIVGSVSIDPPGTLLVSGTPTLTVYGATGTILAGFDGVDVTGWDSVAAAEVRAWFDVDSSELPLGFSTAVFSLTVVGSDGRTRVRKPQVRLEVMRVPAPAFPTDPDPGAFLDQICSEYGHGDDLAARGMAEEYLRLFAVKGLVSPFLLRLYVKRAFAQYLQGQQLEKIDVTTGDIATRAHFIVKNFENDIKALTEEILRIEGQLAGMQAQAGQMIASIPLLSPAGRFPASSPAFIGGPDAPRFWRR